MARSGDLAANGALLSGNDLITQANTEQDSTKRKALLDEAAKYQEGGSYRIAAHTLFGALSGGAGGAAAAGTVAYNAQNLNNLQTELTKSLTKAGVEEKTAKAIANVTFNAGTLVAGNAVGGGAGATAALNVDANNRQLHPTEAKLIKDNAARYAARRGISVERAEAELTQQTLRNDDSAHAARLGAYDPQAQAFLIELGAGKTMVDPMTGQPFQLFAADEATRNNHAIFGQYTKTNDSSPYDTTALLDRAYNKAFKPQNTRAITGLDGSNAGTFTGSDLALMDAAKDYGNMRRHPPGGAVCSAG